MQRSNMATQEYGRKPAGNTTKKITPGGQPAPDSMASRRGLDLRLSQPVRPILQPARGFVSEWDHVINPYINCEFGCSYCYVPNIFNQEEAHKTWGKWVNAKTNAGAQLEQALYAPGKGNPKLLDGKTIYMSTATDPYQPVEKELRVTEAVLRAMAGQPGQHPQPATGRPKPKLCIQTRSPLALRDTQLMQAIIGNGGAVQVNMTVTTDSEEITRRLEAKCMMPASRLEAVRRLSAAGIPVCITVTPFLAASQPGEWIAEMVQSGASSFIIQDMHDTGAGPSRAATRPGGQAAVDAVHREQEREYRQAYMEFRDSFRQAVKEARLTWMGEGKHGFRPPWRS